jgi:hypothetical protein
MSDPHEQNATMTSAQSSPAEPEWVILMREHYRRAGFYRPEDLAKILGNPRSSFEGKPIDWLMLACKRS